MKDEFTKFLYWAIGIFIVGVVGMVSLMTIFACGFSRNCAQAQATVERTPVAVPPAATVPAVVFVGEEQAAPETCRVSASDLVDAWAEAGYPESEPFPFTDADGQSCQATADEVRSVLVMAMPMDAVVSAGVPLP
ncbi:MAG: hypothetical protein AB1846_14630 [Chloroflexota bacterium]